MLDNFAPSKKVAKPPARLAAKTTKASDDVEMNDEAPPKKKAPPNIG